MLDFSSFYHAHQRLSLRIFILFALQKYDCFRTQHYFYARKTVFSAYSLIHINDTREPDTNVTFLQIYYK